MQCIKEKIELDQNIFNVLQDSMFIITNICEEQEEIKNYIVFYENQLKLLRKDLRKSYQDMAPSTKYMVSFFDNFKSKNKINSTSFFQAIQSNFKESLCYIDKTDA